MTSWSNPAGPCQIPSCHPSDDSLSAGKASCRLPEDLQHLLYVKQLSPSDAASSKQIKLPRNEVKGFLGDLRHKQRCMVVVHDHMCVCWEFLCTCYGCQYALSRVAAFANTYQLRPGQFILFYRDTLHRLRMMVSKHLPEELLHQAYSGRTLGTPHPTHHLGQLLVGTTAAAGHAHNLAMGLEPCSTAAEGPAAAAAAAAAGACAHGGSSGGSFWSQAVCSSLLPPAAAAAAAAAGQPSAGMGTRSRGRRAIAGSIPAHAGVLDGGFLQPGAQQAAQHPWGSHTSSTGGSSFYGWQQQQQQQVLLAADSEARPYKQTAPRPPAAAADSGSCSFRSAVTDIWQSQLLFEGAGSSYTAVTQQQQQQQQRDVLFTFGAAAPPGESTLHPSWFDGDTSAAAGAAAAAAAAAMAEGDAYACADVCDGTAAAEGVYWWEPACSMQGLEGSSSVPLWGVRGAATPPLPPAAGFGVGPAAAADNDDFDDMAAAAAAPHAPSTMLGKRMRRYEAFLQPQTSASAFAAAAAAERSGIDAAAAAAVVSAPECTPTRDAAVVELSPACSAAPARAAAAAAAAAEDLPCQQPFQDLTGFSCRPSSLNPAGASSGAGLIQGAEQRRWGFGGFDRGRGSGGSSTLCPPIFQAPATSQSATGATVAAAATAAAAAVADMKLPSLDDILLLHHMQEQQRRRQRQQQLALLESCLICGPPLIAAAAGPSSSNTACGLGGSRSSTTSAAASLLDGLNLPTPAVGTLLFGPSLYEPPGGNSSSEVVGGVGAGSAAAAAAAAAAAGPGTVALLPLFKVPAPRTVCSPEGVLGSTSSSASLVQDPASFDTTGAHSSTGGGTGGGGGGGGTSSAGSGSTWQQQQQYGLERYSQQILLQYLRASTAAAANAPAAAAAAAVRDHTAAGDGDPCQGPPAVGSLAASRPATAAATKQATSTKRASAPAVVGAPAWQVQQGAVAPACQGSGASGRCADLHPQEQQQQHGMALLGRSPSAAAPPGAGAGAGAAGGGRGGCGGRGGIGARKSPSPTKAASPDGPRPRALSDVTQKTINGSGRAAQGSNPGAHNSRTALPQPGKVRATVGSIAWAAPGVELPQEQQYGEAQGATAAAAAGVAAATSSAVGSASNGSAQAGSPELAWLMPAGQTFRFEGQAAADLAAAGSTAAPPAAVAAAAADEGSRLVRVDPAAAAAASCCGTAPAKTAAAAAAGGGVAATSCCLSDEWSAASGLMMLLQQEGPEV